MCEGELCVRVSRVRGVVCEGESCEGELCAGETCTCVRESTNTREWETIMPLLLALISS